MSGVSRASRQGLTSIGLCSPMVSTWRPLSLLLLSGVLALEHLLKEAKLCGRQLTKQEDSEDSKIFGHDSCNAGKGMRMEAIDHAS